MFGTGDDSGADRPGVGEEIGGGTGNDVVVSYDGLLGPLSRDTCFERTSELEVFDAGDNPGAESPEAPFGGRSEAGDLEEIGGGTEIVLVSDDKLAEPFSPVMCSSLLTISLKVGR